MACYRRGGCGPYENRSCMECPASNPEYAKRYQTESALVPEESVVSSGVRLVLTCPGCGNSIWIPKSFIDYECGTCGDVYGEGDMCAKSEPVTGETSV